MNTHPRDLFLQRFTAAYRQTISGHQVMQTALSTHYDADRYMEDLIIEIHGELWAAAIGPRTTTRDQTIDERTEDAEVTEVPASWFQHLKAALGMKHATRSIVTRTVRHASVRRETTIQSFVPFAIKGRPYHPYDNDTMVIPLAGRMDESVANWLGADV